MELSKECAEEISGFLTLLRLTEEVQAEAPNDQLSALMIKLIMADITKCIKKHHTIPDEAEGFELIGDNEVIFIKRLEKKLPLPDDVWADVEPLHTELDRLCDIGMKAETNGEDVTKLRSEAEDLSRDMHKIIREALPDIGDYSIDGNVLTVTERITV